MHWPSVAQAVQLFAVQIWPPLQSVARRQLPVTQPPDRQSWPVAHWPSPVQFAQVLLRQTWPLLQSLLTWQLPVTQVALAPVPTQTRPVPHCPSVVQAAQTWLALQIWPLGAAAVVVAGPRHAAARDADVAGAEGGDARRRR